MEMCSLRCESCIAGFSNRVQYFGSKQHQISKRADHDKHHKHRQPKTQDIPESTPFPFEIHPDDLKHQTFRSGFWEIHSHDAIPFFFSPVSS